MGRAGGINFSAMASEATLRIPKTTVQDSLLHPSSFFIEGRNEHSRPFVIAPVNLCRGFADYNAGISLILGLFPALFRDPHGNPHATRCPTARFRSFLGEGLWAYPRL